MQVGNYKVELNQNLKEDTLLNLVYKYMLQLISEFCKGYMTPVKFDEVFMENEIISKVINFDTVYVLRMKQFRVDFFEASVFKGFAEQIMDYITILNGKTNKWYKTAGDIELWLIKHITLSSVEEGYENYLRIQKNLMLKDNSIEKSASNLASWIFPFTNYIADDEYFLENGQTIVGSSIDINQKYRQVKSFLNKNLPHLSTSITNQTENNPWFLVFGIIIFLVIGFIFVFLFLFLFKF